MTSFVTARLVDRQPAGGSLVRLTATHEARASHTRPGQYAEVRASGATGYFVIASDVGDPHWCFVIRGGGGAADVLLATPIGGTFEMTAALGDGFPMETARGKRLLVAVNGTGVAAALPVVRSRIAEGDAERTTLLVGVRSPEEVPLAGELDRWAGAGVTVKVCISQPREENQDAGLRGAVRGHVQDVAVALARSDPAQRPDAVFVVGVPSLVEAMRERAPDLGLRASDVHTNY